MQRARGLKGGRSEAPGGTTKASNPAISGPVGGRGLTPPHSASRAPGPSGWGTDPTCASVTC